MTSPSSKFSFIDEGEALRHLGVDRDTLQTLVQEKRLRAYPGVGKGSFFRAADVEALRAELSADATALDQPSATDATPPGRKLFDPSYKVHVRLQADLKWYDLEDDDLKAWAREMTPDGYARQRTNITRVIEKLQRMIELMDEAAAGWKTFTPPAPPPDAGPSGSLIQPTITRRQQRKPLPMAGPAPTQPPETSE
jgi:hypothetical protein